MAKKKKKQQQSPKKVIEFLGDGLVVTVKVTIKDDSKREKMIENLINFAKESHGQILRKKPNTISVLFPGIEYAKKFKKFKYEIISVEER